MYIHALGTVIILFVSTQFGTVRCFGAGNVPKISWLEGKGFRHGDIDDSLAGWIQEQNQRNVSNPWKFEADDVERIYFGNWLRDFSQIVDERALRIMSLQNLMRIIITFGLLTRGYAMGGYQINEARLGAYLPVEHIDNPKGYAEGADARKHDHRLRPPVDPAELKIDPATGMKNYIANEGGTWDTSAAYVRRTLQKSGYWARMYRSTGKDEFKWEAYRLLGGALHTLEDFSAHSNFCELALRSLGYTDVFPYVGNLTTIRAPTGEHVYPLVTGTFSGKDFLHSIISEVSDSLSEKSIQEFHSEVKKAEDKANARQQESDGEAGTGGLSRLSQSLHNAAEKLGKMISDGWDELPDEPDLSRFGRRGVGDWFGEDSDSVAEKKDRDEQGGFIRNVMVFSEKLAKKVVEGLIPVVDKAAGVQGDWRNLEAKITVSILRKLEPVITPFLRMSTEKLHEMASDVLVDSKDQWEVFDNPMSTDPTHSIISKDHFRMILNEPAGNLARIIVLYTADRLLPAWESPAVDEIAIIDDILRALFHPDFHDPTSVVQVRMLAYMRNWIESQTEKARTEVLRRLTRWGVRGNENERFHGYRMGDGLDAIGNLMDEDRERDRKEGAWGLGEVVDEGDHRYTRKGAKLAIKTFLGQEMLPGLAEVLRSAEITPDTN